MKTGHRTSLKSGAEQQEKFEHAKYQETSRTSDKITGHDKDPSNRIHVFVFFWVSSHSHPCLTRSGAAEVLKKTCQMPKEKFRLHSARQAALRGSSAAWLMQPSFSSERDSRAAQVRPSPCESCFTFLPRRITAPSQLWRPQQIQRKTFPCCHQKNATTGRRIRRAAWSTISAEGEESKLDMIGQYWF